MGSCASQTAPADDATRAGAPPDAATAGEGTPVAHRRASLSVFSKQAEQQAALSTLLALQLAEVDSLGDVQLQEACWTETPIADDLLDVVRVESSDGARTEAAVEGESPLEETGSAAD